MINLHVIINIVFNLDIMVNNMTPTVTIVTLLTDRREFLPLLKACINNQNYDKSKLEWVILDDGEDSNLDFDNCSVKPTLFPLFKNLQLAEKGILHAEYQLESLLLSLMMMTSITLLE